jgi:hypothetical protein
MFFFQGRKFRSRTDVARHFGLLIPSSAGGGGGGGSGAESNSGGSRAKGHPSPVLAPKPHAVAAPPHPFTMISKSASAQGSAGGSHVLLLSLWETY